jgi:polar amino acid transport system ATP-binding protein
MLKIKNVCKKYGEQTILSNINLDIDINTIVGLAGPSGSGKSTLLRCIQKLETVSSGELVCTETTGFMFQDFQLFPHMTVRENLEYAPKLHGMSDIQERSSEILQQLNILHKQDFYPCDLSGGQKQRVALARLLMMKPTLLLCDEPTSGLDIATIIDVVGLLKKVQQERHITMIIASHDLQFLNQLADRIILLKHGVISLDINMQATPDGLKILEQGY